MRQLAARWWLETGEGENPHATETGKRHESGPRVHPARGRRLSHTCQHATVDTSQGGNHVSENSGS